MNERTDIRDRRDIELLIDSFYAKVKQDDVIGFFFANVDWPNHLPNIYSFWESIVFGTAAYRGDPMTAHRHIHEKHPMEHHHFERWVELFKKTTDELFTGINAETVKARADSIARLMEFKVTGK
jgi:hemoglobin